MRIDDDNYEKMSVAASERFLTFDQEEIFARWPLLHNEESIFIRFVGKDYRIDRRSGRIYEGDRMASHAEVLSILDMICLSQKPPNATGEWVTLTQLTNAAGVGPADTKLLGQVLSPFDGRTKALDEACRRLGGQPMKVGDVSWLIPAFDHFPVWFRYWEGDDEFPASISFLWDKSTPQHLHYETTWYVMQHILRRLIEIDQTEGTKYESDTE
ncbi:MAG: DUF3786 domain-containing protein [Blautia sp.]|nr:DUF3786 domain-containing protein [Blautia sp.]